MEEEAMEVCCLLTDLPSRMCSACFLIQLGAICQAPSLMEKMLHRLDYKPI